MSLAFLIFGWRERRGWKKGMFAAMVLAGACFLTGCGGGGSSHVCNAPTPTPVTSAVNITASADSIQQTATFTLVVNRPAACN